MRILVVEDEAELAGLLCRNLGREGFAADQARTLAEADAALAAIRYDVVLLDLGLPDGDGLEQLRHWRQAGRGHAAAVPVIAVTARDAVADRVRGLNAGADDYLVKPFAQEELVARINALLRRPGTPLGTVLTAAALEFDTGSRSVTIAGRPLAVPRRELAALELLMRRAGRAVTRDALETALYPQGEEVESNAIEAHLSRLRKRLAEAGAGVTIIAVRGIGYILNGQDGP